MDFGAIRRSGDFSRKFIRYLYILLFYLIFILFLLNIFILGDWRLTFYPEFGKNFLPTAKKILSRMFRVYAHVYHCHWEKVKVYFPSSPPHRPLLVPLPVPLPCQISTHFIRSLLAPRLTSILASRYPSLSSSNSSPHAIPISTKIVPK